jgi:hypothetical protein
MTRVGHALLTFVGGACLAVGCSGASPRDQNFNTDAGANFVPPPPSFDGGADTAGAGGAAGDIDAAGAGGSGGAAGTGTASSDADTDAASDGGTP